MTTEEIKDKLIQKIDYLLKHGHRITYESKGKYRHDIVRIDCIMFCKEGSLDLESSESSENVNVTWEQAIYLGFHNNLILSGKEAKEVYQHFLGSNTDLVEKYLNKI